MSHGLVYELLTVPSMPSFSTHLVSFRATSDFLTYVRANDHSDHLKKKIGHDRSQQADEVLSDQRAKIPLPPSTQGNTEKSSLQPSRGNDQNDLFNVDRPHFLSLHWDLLMFLNIFPASNLKL